MPEKSTVFLYQRTKSESSGILALPDCRRLAGRILQVAKASGIYDVQRHRRPEVAGLVAVWVFTSPGEVRLSPDAGMA